jgi:signal peptidase I
MWWWLVAGVIAVAALLVWRKLVVVTVDGPSMEPSYPDGAKVLAWRTSRARTGQVVMVAPEIDEGPARVGRLWLMKRLVASGGEIVPAGLEPALRPGDPVPPGRLVLLGDNPAQSHDSRQDGFVDASRLRAVVLRVLH